MRGARKPKKSPEPEDLSSLPSEPLARATALLHLAIRFYEAWADELEARVDAVAEANMMLTRADEMVEQGKALLLLETQNRRRDDAQDRHDDRLDGGPIHIASHEAA